MSTTHATGEFVLTREEEPKSHWVSRAAFPILTYTLFSLQACLAIALYYNNYWLVVPLALVTSHFMHGVLIGFHEASHRLLRKSRFMNDLDGYLIGIFSFSSFTLYRAAHQTHHMHLATERDEELWPFVHPTSPRWLRVVAAVLELTVGLVFTPLLFLRTFFRSDSPIRSKKVRRRIWAELGVIVLSWALILSLDAYFHAWKYFLWTYLIPALLAANMQSWRKYIEHVGMTGNTPNSATRSIIAPGPLGKFLAFTLLHEPYHGVHHQHSGLPHAEMPFHANVLEPKEPGDVPPFPSYREAVFHLLRSLLDPKVGSQWNRAVKL